MKTHQNKNLLVNLSIIVSLTILLLIQNTTRAQQAFSSILKQESDIGLIYHKSQLGLMPPAYGRFPTTDGTLEFNSLLNSGYLNSFAVYPSGSWPEGVASGRWAVNSAALSTSFDFDPPNDNRIHIFTQTNTGVLTRTQQLSTGSNPTAVARGDFNQNGRDDLAVINQQSNSLSIYLQQLDGSLGAATTYPTGSSPDALVVGDFNGDLRDDIAVAHGVSQYIAIYHQLPDSTFASPIQYGLSSGGFNDLEVGDLNSDGYDDLVVMRGAGHQSSQVAIFYQQNRAFIAPIFRTVQTGGYLPHGLAVGDVTSDGQDDVVVTAGGNVPNAYLNVFAQQTDGALAVSPVIYPAFHLPEAVVIGDINHDGRDDVVLVHAAWMSLSVYIQATDGTLNAYEQYPLPYTDYYRTGGLDLGDVDNNGAQDILIASRSSLPEENGLVVLTNSGNAPTATISSPAVGVYITNTTTLLIEGTASPNAVTLQISTDGGQTWDDQSSAPSWNYTWALPDADGNYTLLVRAIDNAGRVQSPPARTRIVIDRTLPTGSLLINEDAVYTNTPIVTLSVSGSDFNGLSTMRFSNQGDGYSNWYSFALTYTWTLSDSDGLKTVLGQVHDVPGNISDPFGDAIILDTTPPTCSTLINNGASYTNSSQATLTLTSTDTNGVSQMRVRNSGGNWSAWQSYATSLTWNLGSGSDGSRTIEAQFLDVAGNESSICNATIILDQTPPSCSIVVNNGSAYINQANVTLTLSSTDNYGVSQMHFSNDGTTWSSWASYAATGNWNLVAPDGSKTVYARFRDVANNISAICQDNIILDTISPTGFIIIDGGATHATVANVTLTSGASDASTVADMRFSNDNVNWSAWFAYGTTSPWALTAGDGNKTVYVQYRDIATNVGGPFTDNIILDTTPPAGSVTIDNGATYTHIPTVTLTIAATDATAVANMRLSHDSTTWLDWELYATSRSWTLADSDGVKTVYIQFQDTLGNISEAFGDAIVLDATPPDCQLFINSGAAHTAQPDVTLQVSCADTNPPIQVRYSNDGMTWSDWEGYTAVKNWALASDDGLQTVYLQAQDTPGNISQVVNSTITLDTTAPACTLLINEGDFYTTSLNVDLAINCADTNGLGEIRLSNDGTSWEAWQPYITSLPWTLVAGEGQKSVYLQANDIPGNTSTPLTTTIILDTVLPSGGCTIQNNNGYVNNVNVNMTLWSYDDNSVPDMQIRNQGDSWGDWIPSAASINWTIPNGDGGKAVECRFRDAAGNVSITYSDQVILDTQPPTCQVEINGGVAYVNDHLVTLILESSDNYGMNGMRFSHDATSWTSWEAYATSRSWTLQTNDGNKIVWAQFRDLAGNVAQCNDDVLLDTAPPVGEISIVNGADYTIVPTVTVTLTATDNLSGIDQTCLSEETSLCSDWQPYVTETTWSFFDPNGQGERQLCAWFQDFSGNQSEAVCDTITLHSIPPIGEININDDAVYINQLDTLLTVWASDEVVEVTAMRFSHDSANWQEWEPYAEFKQWELLPGDGEKVVYAQFQNAIGNNSLTYSDTITLDAVVPIGTVSINNGAGKTTNPEVTLTLNAQDESSNVCDMQMRNSDSAWTNWQTYTETILWQLETGMGDRTVEARFRDCAGNVSVTVEASIWLGHSLYLPILVSQ